MPQNNEQKKEKKTPSANAKKKRPLTAAERKKILTRVSIVCVAVVAATVLLILGVYHIAVDYYLGRINYQSEETDIVFETEFIEDSTYDENYTYEYIPGNEDCPRITSTKDVTNILLLATDERGKEASRSDTMILVSINNKTKKIVLCSFMRDILATFPEEPKSPAAGRQDKLTHAHAYGGAALTMAVLRETFNVDVNYYAKVNFYDFTKIIDAIGGLEVPLTSKDIYVINDWLSEKDRVNDRLGTTAADLIVNKGDGLYQLNGKQVLYFARNRDIGSDWGRTQRQREVLELILTKISKLPLTKIASLFNDVLPLVTTNIPKKMLKDMVGNVLDYATYDRVSTRVPENGKYSEENYNIIVFPENLYRLYEEIYGAPAEDDPRYTNKETAAN